MLKLSRGDSTPEFDQISEVERNYDYDRDRFYENAIAANPEDSFALTIALTSAYHSIEKGLAMAAPRAGFALQRVQFILDAIPILEGRGLEGLATRGARGSLVAYVRYHDSRGMPLPPEVATRLRELVVQSASRGYPGGTVRLAKAELHDAADFDFAKFVKSRFSVRNFTGEAVAAAEIEAAVDCAIKSPRTSNRELRRVYAVYDPKVRDRLLSFHRGNVGFGHNLGAVLVIATDMRGYNSIDERNLCWLDGGLFAMTLTLALHAAGLGTCMLNWAEPCDQDRRMRQEFGIPDYEAVVTFLGVGHVPDEFEVAASPGPHAQDILKTIGPEAIQADHPVSHRNNWY